MLIGVGVAACVLLAAIYHQLIVVERTLLKMGERLDRLEAIQHAIGRLELTGPARRTEGE